MKRNILIIFALFCLIGCSNGEQTIENKGYYDAYSLIDSNEIISFTSFAELDGDVSNPKYVENLSTDIALITITSIEGGSNYGYQTNEYCYPYTYGKFEAIKVYKGDLKTNEELNYIRAGGIIDSQSYYLSLSQAEKEKYNSLTNNNIPKYMQFKFDGDIDVEVGKTYLAYLCNQKSGEGVFAMKDSYMIISFEGGLREADIISVANGDDLSEVKVLNNFTGEWEYINQVLD